MGALEFFEARHPHLTRQIMLAKKKGRLAHAYLLHSDKEETRESFATALAMTAAMANPPRKRAITELANSNSAFEIPPCVAKLPIRMNSGITLRS